jgi:hypothetical protein
VVKCGCGKVCKNTKGLRIYRARSKCNQGNSQSQRADQSYGEPLRDTQSGVTPQYWESLSAAEGASSCSWDLNDPQEAVETAEGVQPADKKEIVDWPKMDQEKKWKDLDIDLSTLRDSIENQLQTFTTIVQRGQGTLWYSREEKCKKNSKSIKQFRTISLLSAEGKIFFSVMARRMTDYMRRTSTLI